MRNQELLHIACPNCLGDFELKPERTDSQSDIIRGTLMCKKCSNRYEIRNGIPLLLNTIDDNLHKGVQEMFNETPYGLLGARNAIENKDKIDINAINRTPWYIPEKDVTGKKMLEAGCGGGHLYTELHLLGADVTGLDMTPNSLESIRRLFHESGMRPKLINGNIEKLPIRDESFDIITSMGVIHHSADTQKALTRLSMALKKDGSLYLMLYHKHSIWNYVKIALRFGCRHSRLFNRFIFKLTPLWMGETATQSNRETVFRDNMVNPITKSFTARELELMAKRAGMRIDFLSRYEIPELYVLGRRIYQSRFLRWYEKRFGWFLTARLKKV